MNIGAALSSSLTPGLSSLGAATPVAPSTSSFSDLFKTAVGNVDGLQTQADTNIGNLVSGAPNTDVGSVMVSVEKADVAFQLMMQVRNKVVSAYQDLEKMQF